MKTSKKVRKVVEQMLSPTRIAWKSTTQHTTQQTQKMKEAAKKATDKTRKLLLLQQQQQTQQPKQPKQENANQNTNKKNEERAKRYSRLNYLRLKRSSINNKTLPINRNQQHVKTKNNNNNNNTQNMNKTIIYTSVNQQQLRIQDRVKLRLADDLFFQHCVPPTLHGREAIIKAFQADDDVKVEMATTQEEYVVPAFVCYLDETILNERREESQKSQSTWSSPSSCNPSTSASPLLTAHGPPVIRITS